MRIPRTIKIGAHTFQVELLPLEGKCGDADRTKNKIRLDKNLPESQQGATFFHEIIHCLNSELNHTLIDSLAEQLYQVMSDNKLLK